MQLFGFVMQSHLNDFWSSDVACLAEDTHSPIPFEPVGTCFALPPSPVDATIS